MLGGSAHVQYLANGRARSVLCHGIIRHCAPWSKCHPCGTRALSVPGCCKSLPLQVQLMSASPSAFLRRKRSSLLPLRCCSPLEQMQSLSLCVKWMFWGGLCWQPPAQCPPARCDREQGRAGWLADVAAASWSVGICSWNNWLGAGVAPAHSRCAGGVYEPREEALVKVWGLRASSAAKLAVLCKGCEGLGARAPSASVFLKHRSVVVSSR